MQIRADFSRFVAVRPQAHRWISSPQSGVDRVLLDRQGTESGRATSLLYSDATEHVSLQRLDAGEGLNIIANTGTEVLVVAGALVQGGETFDAGSWLRMLQAPASNLVAAPGGAMIYLKTGHLAPA